MLGWPGEESALIFAKWLKPASTLLMRALMINHSFRLSPLELSLVSYLFFPLFRPPLSAGHSVFGGGESGALRVDV